jgi:hypothetical protein
MIMITKRHTQILTLSFYFLFSIHTALLPPVWCSKGDEPPALEFSCENLRCLCISFLEEEHHHTAQNTCGGESLSSPPCCSDTPAAGTWWAQLGADTFRLDDRATVSEFQPVPHPRLCAGDTTANLRFHFHPLSKFLIQPHQNPRFTVLRC